MSEDKDGHLGSQPSNTSKDQEETSPSTERQKDDSTSTSSHEATTNSVQGLVVGDHNVVMQSAKPDVLETLFDFGVSDIGQTIQAINALPVLSNVASSRLPDSSLSSLNILSRDFLTAIEFEIQNAFLVNEILPEPTSGTPELPATDIEIADWYYGLADYERCFVQAIAVLHGAPLDAIVRVANELYEPKPTRGLSSSPPRVQLLSELLAYTYTRVFWIRGAKRLFWQDTDTNGRSAFDLRLLRFLALELPIESRGLAKLDFLDLLERWSEGLSTEVSLKSAYALGVVWSILDRAQFHRKANAWAHSSQSRDWQRLAYFLNGAYEIDRIEPGENVDAAERAPVLQLLNQWVGRVHEHANAQLGCAAAYAYGIIGRRLPEIALQGLDNLLFFGQNEIKDDGGDLPLAVFIATISRYVTLPWYGYIRDVLSHLATASQYLSHQWHPSQKSNVYLKYRSHRRVSLEALFNIFFLVAASSLAVVGDEIIGNYSIVGSLPQSSRFPDDKGRDVLLAGILADGEAEWRFYLCTILSTAIIERKDEQAFFLMRQWAEIVLEDQSVNAGYLRTKYNQFMVDVGKMVDHWFHSMELAGVHPWPATDVFKRRLAYWQSESRVSRHPIGAFARSVLGQLTAANAMSERLGLVRREDAKGIFKLFNRGLSLSRNSCLVVSRKNAFIGSISSDEIVSDSDLRRRYERLGIQDSDTILRIDLGSRLMIISDRLVTQDGYTRPYRLILELRVSDPITFALKYLQQSDPVDLAKVAIERDLQGYTVHKLHDDIGKEALEYIVEQAVAEGVNKLIGLQITAIRELMLWKDPLRAKQFEILQKRKITEEEKGSEPRSEEIESSENTDVEETSPSWRAEVEKTALTSEKERQHIVEDFLRMEEPRQQEDSRIHKIDEKNHLPHGETQPSDSLRRETETRATSMERQKRGQPRLDLVVIARPSLEEDGRAMVGKIYRVQAGVSWNIPRGFKGKSFSLFQYNGADYILFDISLHTSENIELLAEWSVSLLYRPLDLGPQLSTFEFRVIAPGSSFLALDFYHERRLIKTMRLQFDAVENIQPSIIAAEV